MVIGIALGVVFGAALLIVPVGLFIMCCCCHRCTKTSKPPPRPAPPPVAPQLGAAKQQVVVEVFKPDASSVLGLTLTGEGGCVVTAVRPDG